MNTLRTRLALLIDPSLGETIRRLCADTLRQSGLVETLRSQLAQFENSDLGKLREALEIECDMTSVLDREADQLSDRAAEAEAHRDELLNLLAGAESENAELRRRLKRTHVRDAAGRFVKVGA